MSYVETCNKHGQYHADYICVDCVEDLTKERDAWKDLVDRITELPCCDSKYPGCKACAAIDLLAHSGLKLK